MAKISSIKARKGYARYNKYANYAMQGFKTARQLYNSYSRTKTKKNSTSAVGITRNHDFSVQYRKKRMPRWKRRSWANFSKKVNAVLTAKLATQTQLFNRPITLTNPANSQNYMAAVIYGKNGQNGSECAGMSDLRDIVNIAALTTGEKLMFKSAILDVTLAVPSDAASSLEVDIYDCYWRGQTLQVNVRTDIQAAESNTSTLPSGSSLELNDRGATLFDLPVFLSNTKCKILKKTKVFLPPGNTTTYQIRDPRNRTIYVDDITEYQASGLSGWIQPGWTRGIVVVFKPTAGNQATVNSLNMGVTTKYAYVLMKDNDVRDASN